MNNETQKSSTKYTYKLIVFDPENAGYGVSESPIFQNFPGGACPRTPYIIRGIGADSLFVSPVTWCLTFSYKNNLYTTSSRSLNAEETIQNETKLTLGKSLSQ